MTIIIVQTARYRLCIHPRIRLTTDLLKRTNSYKSNITEVLHKIYVKYSIMHKQNPSSFLVHSLKLIENVQMLMITHGTSVHYYQ